MSFVPIFDTDELLEELEEERNEQRQREERQRECEGHRRRRKGYVIPDLGEGLSTPLEGFPDAICRVLDDRLDAGARVLVRAPAGAGKTWAVAQWVAQRVRAEGRRVTWATPTMTTRAEAAETLRGHLDDCGEAMTMRSYFAELGLRVTEGRNADTCERHEVGAAANRAAPNGWGLVCQACHLNDPELCPFIASREERRRAEAPIVVQTTAMLAMTTPALDAPRRLERVAWNVIASKVRAASARYVPWVRQTERALILEVHADADGAPLPILPSHLSELEGEGHTLTDEGRRLMWRWFGEALGVEGERRAVFDALEARGRVDEYLGGDLLVIDESALNHLFGYLTLDAGEWSRLASAHNLSPEARGAVAELIDAGDYLDHSALASALEDVTLPELDARDQTEAVRAVVNRGGGLEELEQLNDYRAERAWNAALRSGWAGAYIDRGKLHLPAPRRLDFERWRAVVMLDATGTPRTARAMLGAQAECLNITIDDAPTPRVTWVPAELPKNETRGAGWRYDSTHDVHRAIHRLADSPETLHGLHKRQLDAMRGANDEPLAGTLLEELDGQATHFNGREARGSNAFEDCTRAVFDTYHHNSKAAEALAHLLCLGADEDWGDVATREAWRDEAQYQMLGAPIVQFAERIRPIRATEARPVELIFTGARSPEGLGYPVSCTLDPHEVALLGTGNVHNRDPWSADGYICKVAVNVLRAWVPERGQRLAELLEGAEDARAALRSCLDTFGGGDVPDWLFTAFQAALHGFYPERALYKATLGEKPWSPSVHAGLAEIDVFDAYSRLSACLNGGIETLAERVGLRVARGGAGRGRPHSILLNQGVDLEELAELMGERFVWLELEGERWERSRSELLVSAWLEHTEELEGASTRDVARVLSSSGPFESIREVERAIRRAGGLQAVRALVAERVSDDGAELSRSEGLAEVIDLERVRIDRMAEQSGAWVRAELETMPSVVLAHEDHASLGAELYSYRPPSPTHMREALATLSPQTVVISAGGVGAARAVATDAPPLDVSRARFELESGRWFDDVAALPWLLVRLWPDYEAWRARVEAGRSPVMWHRRGTPEREEYRAHSRYGEAFRALELRWDGPYRRELTRVERLEASQRRRALLTVINDDAEAPRDVPCPYRPGESTAEELEEWLGHLSAVTCSPTPTPRRAEPRAAPPPRFWVERPGERGRSPLNMRPALRGAAHVLSEALGRDLDGEWELAAHALLRATHQHVIRRELE